MVSQLGPDGRPAGDPERLVNLIAGDDIGFDVVDGALAARRAQQPGAVYGVPRTVAQTAAG
jgi:hypothetical protein